MVFSPVCTEKITAALRSENKGAFKVNTNAKKFWWLTSVNPQWKLKRQRTNHQFIIEKEV